MGMMQQGAHLPVADTGAATTRGAIFHWDLNSDRLHWSNDAHEVLGVGPQTDISTHPAMMLLVDSAHVELRREAIFNAAQRGERHYATTWRMMPQGRGEGRGFMVMERGFWLPDAKGNPAHVFGSITPAACGNESNCAIPGVPEMDPSSGLFCRSYFFKRLEHFLRTAEERRQHAAVLLVSLRNYSIIFDAYGFKAADAAYAEMARRLNRVLRAGDVIARYSENRVALLLHDCMEDDLDPAMQRFLNAPMTEPVETDSAPVWPLLSIGAALLPQQARTVTEAISCAEDALAEAEESPSSSAVVFKTAANKVSRRAIKARFANELFDMLRQKRFTLAFQPIVRADGQTVMCHEALLRVREGKELKPAGHLVPVAEELGVIRLLDMEVLNLALAAMRQQPEGCLAINISAMTVLSGEEFLAHLCDHKELVHGRLIVEITESAMLSNTERVNAFIDSLHALGCRVALDDFGAGYTSFRNLRDFHFDIVKLDGAFCENLSENAQNQHFVRSLIELARKIDIELVAEWVENEQDAALLREWGVDALQGYLFGTPGDEGMWQVPDSACCGGSEENGKDAGEAEADVLRTPQRRMHAGDGAEQGSAATPDMGAAMPEPPRPQASQQAQRQPAAPVREELAPVEEPAAIEKSATAGESDNTGETTMSADAEEAVPGEVDGASPLRQAMQELEDDLRRLREMLMQMHGAHGERSERGAHGEHDESGKGAAAAGAEETRSSLGG